MAPYVATVGADALLPVGVELDAILHTARTADLKDWEL